MSGDICTRYSLKKWIDNFYFMNWFFIGLGLISYYDIGDSESRFISIT